VKKKGTRGKPRTRIFRKWKSAEAHAERLRQSGCTDVRVAQKRPPDGDVAKTRWLVTWRQKPSIGNIKATMGVGPLRNKVRFWRGR
jgi:hypothetical protein